VLEEAAQHAVTAAQLAPDDWRIVFWAAFVSKLKGDYAPALRYGKQALALASTVEDKISTLQIIADIYESNNLYADARSYLREAMQIDDCNVDVIGCMALCYYMEGNLREALRMAKRGLMLDPNDKLCQKVYGDCERRD
jgi:tetratricopeptide (TPR) repeat protein